MTHLAVIATLALANPALSAGQSAVAAPAGDGSSAPQTVRAAGMPLPDGALPPGSLTVRLVQGAFAGDLEGVTVEVELDGRDTRRAQTGALGRAEFAHLPVGVQARASATVNGERLQSVAFPMPAESGVRVLLVAAAGGAAAHLPPPIVGVQAPISEAALPPAGDQGSGATAVRITVVSLTVLAFGLVAAQHWRRRRR